MRKANKIRRNAYVCVCVWLWLLEKINLKKNKTSLHSLSYNQDSVSHRIVCNVQYIEVKQRSKGYQQRWPTVWLTTMQQLHISN